MSAADLLPGDFVQVRMKGTTPSGVDQFLVTEFTATSVVGTVVHGSVLYPDGLDEAAGWEFELISRAVAALPTVLTEIVATLTDGSTATLMGKGRVWADAQTGNAVHHEDITAFTPTDDQGAS